MKNYMASIFLLIVSVAISVWLFLNWKEFKTYEKSYLLFTVTLIIITAFYAWQTQKMVEEMQKTNKLNYRPYILIQGVSRNFLSRQAQKKIDEIEIKSVYDSNEHIFGYARAPGNVDYLYYSLKNVGNVPATEVVQAAVTVFEVNGDTGEKKSIEVSQTTGQNVIFPGTEINRLMLLGKEVAYKNINNTYLEVTLKINYRGDKEMDKNKYFTAITLRHLITSSPQNASIEILNEDVGMLKK